MQLFEELLKDEEGQIDHSETEHALVESIGIANQGLLQAGGSREG
jgi:bacterioferritin (cytochrome b1)